jgi:hypothetical protein
MARCLQRQHEGLFVEHLKPSRYFGFAAALVQLSAFTSASADALDSWQWRNPLPQGSTLNGIAYGNGLFVAVGKSGTIVTSTDAKAWSSQESHTSQPLLGVTFGGGLFVAVGGNFLATEGVLLTSPDGQNWRSIPVPGASVEKRLEAVAHGGDIFMAVGVKGKVMTSTDGATWSLLETRTDGIPNALFSFENYVDVACGDGVFVAMTDYGGELLRSKGGQSWQKLRLDRTYSFEAITYGNGQFVILASDLILTSKDGLNWGAKGVRGGGFDWINSAVFADGMFVAAGSGGRISQGGPGLILNSRDGLNWTTSLPAAPQSFNSITHGSGMFVAVGEHGAIQTSTNALDWANLRQGIGTTLSSIAFGNGQFVAVGSGGIIFKSDDGQRWTSLNAEGQPWLGRVIFADGKFVAVGRSGIGTGQSGIILTSSDGKVWSRHATGGRDALTDIAYGNGRFVAVAVGFMPFLPGSFEGTEAGVAWVSENGIDWTGPFTFGTPVNGPAGSSPGIAYGNGRFWASWRQTFCTSTEGASWRTSRLIDYAFNDKLAYGNGAFVAVGQGYIKRSTTGDSWINVQGPNSKIADVQFAPGLGLFIGVGSEGAIATSPDGAQWTARQSGAAALLNGAAYGNGTLVVVGEGGAVLQASLGHSLGSGRLQPAGFEFAISGGLQRPYRIQVSSNLITWTNLAGVTNTPTKLPFVDRFAPQAPVRFYRTVSP